MKQDDRDHSNCAQAVDIRPIFRDMSFIHAGSLEACTLFTVDRQRSTRITGRLKDKQTPRARAILMERTVK
jgi:hypothetical protein